MAMGRRKPHQESMLLPTVRGGGHRFYEALGKLLDDAGFDAKVEALCAPHYAGDDVPGRPSIAPGLYFRMLLVGYFEGIGSERGIAWRCADSISLRDFLKLPLHVPVPDSSTVSRTRRRLPSDVFESVFRLVLAVVDDKGLLRGKVRGVDSTYLKADASMRSIVRKDTGEDYREYIKRVTAEDEAAKTSNAYDDSDAGGAAGGSGGTDAGDSTSAEKPAAPTMRKVTDEEARRHDRKRKKTTSNQDWKSPTDDDARITRMKNGTTRLAYKAEHVVDMETGAILAAEVLKGDEHDAGSIEASLVAAEQNIAAAAPATVKDVVAEGEAWHKEPTAEVVADKGYHKASVLLALKERGYRTFIPEKKQRGRRKFVDKGGAATARAFHANRARTQRPKGKALQRRRGELLERPNQHLYDRGHMRELTVTGQANVKKRVLVQAAGFNLGLVMRQLLGAGTPKRLAAAIAAVLAALWAAISDFIGGTERTDRHQERRSWEPPWSPLHAATAEIGVFTSA